MRATIASLSLAALVASCSSTGTGTAGPPYETKSMEISYEHDGVSLTGFLARPVGVDGDVPGVLVVHEWWGHNEYARRRARDLAELGYVAFALDMYGDGKLADHPETATEFYVSVMDHIDVMEGRFRAALDVLNGQDGVDASRTGAIGYCMGGGIVLRMGRAGLGLDAVASFHGSLGAALEGGDVDASHTLVCTGGADPFVEPEQVEAFQEAWTAASGDDQSLVVEVYPGVKHSFTNPAATENGQKFGMPLEYDEAADEASWKSMQATFRAAFGTGR